MKTRSIFYLFLSLMITTASACAALPVEGGAGDLLISRAELLLMESFPVQVRLEVSGTLASDCVELRWTVGEADHSGRIDVLLETQTSTAGDCASIRVPFNLSIPIGDYTSGKHSVWLNGEQAGEFDLGDAGANWMLEGPVFLEGSQLIEDESEPASYRIKVWGALPTVCHTLQWSITQPAGGKIEIQLYSMAPAEQICIQVLAPFEAEIPIPQPGAGTWELVLDGKPIGTIEN